MTLPISMTDAFLKTPVIMRPHAPRSSRHIRFDSCAGGVRVVRGRRKGVGGGGSKTMQSGWGEGCGLSIDTHPPQLRVWLGVSSLLGAIIFFP